MAHGEDRHVELPTAEVSSGWSNDPALLRVKPYFMDRHRVNECLHPTLYFLHPQLILKDAQSTYIFEEKGRGYFVWNDISGSVAETKEKSLEDIIVKLSDSGLASITLSPLRTLDDPSEEPTSNIPYPLNPDFVDRSCLTKIFRIPPHRSILLYGPAGCGKSELAIKYASKVRTDSPETWVFWLCATTRDQICKDLIAIADILPECPTTKDKHSRLAFVIDWLCKSGGEPWLMVVDDVSSAAEDFSGLDTLWNSEGRGSFIFTSRESLRDSKKPYFESSLRLKVKSLTGNEVLQLLQKKLKQPSDADCCKLMTEWTPLAVELTAVCLNKGLNLPWTQAKTPAEARLVSALIGHMDQLGAALRSVFDSLSSFEKGLLYFVSSFQPPEIPKLWMLSFMEWENNIEESYEVAPALRSLTELSLLVYVSSTNTYKMHAVLQDFFAAQLQIEDPLLENIKSFVESQKFIPSYRLRNFRSYSEEMQRYSGPLSSGTGHHVESLRLS